MFGLVWFIQRFMSSLMAVFSQTAGSKKGLFRILVSRVLAWQRPEIQSPARPKPDKTPAWYIPIIVVPVLGAQNSPWEGWLFIQNIFRSVTISVFGQALVVPVLSAQNDPLDGWLLMPYILQIWFELNFNLNSNSNWIFNLLQIWIEIRIKIQIQIKIKIRIKIRI